MDDEIIEGILFLRPTGISLDRLKDINVEDLINRINVKYEKTVLHVVIKDRRLVMEIKPEYVDKIASYYEDRELSDRQIKALGLLRMHGKMAKSEIKRKLSSQEFLDLLNRNFIKIEKIDKKEFVLLGAGYYQYFKDNNAKG